MFVQAAASPSRFILHIIDKIEFQTTFMDVFIIELSQIIEQFNEFTQIFASRSTDIYRSLALERTLKND